MTFKIHFITKETDWKPLLPELRKAARPLLKALLKAENISTNQTISVVLANNFFIQEYNHQYRDKNKPTNILSFSSDEDGYLGDLILAYETIAKEASEQQKLLLHHCLHLLVHGVLHLLGYDHETPTEADQMEAKEITILAEWGIRNPY